MHTHIYIHTHIIGSHINMTIHTYTHHHALPFQRLTSGHLPRCEPASDQLQPLQCWVEWPPPAMYFPGGQCL